MTSNPFTNWFWQDWDADPNLKVCSLAAQGLWMRMLAVMAKGDPVGHLVIAGKPVSDAQLARLVGETPDVIAGLREELGAAGVYSVTRDGIIFNRRMVRDAELSRKRAESGRRGAEVTNRKTKRNPDLPQQNTRHDDKSSERQKSGPITNTNTITSSNTDFSGEKSDRGKYAFQGKVIRLTPENFTSWEQAYSHLDLRAELVARDAWLAADASDADRKRWFISTSKYLANRNAEAMQRTRASNGHAEPEPTVDPATIPATKWKIMIEMIVVERTGPQGQSWEWRDAYGPPPGHPGSHVPKELWTPEVLEFFAKQEDAA